VDIATRISTARRANGLSAGQLARLAGVSTSTITRLEAGEVSPSFDLACTLLEILGQVIEAGPSASVDAIVAARLVLDPVMPVEQGDKVREWVGRLGRVAPRRGESPRAAVLRTAALAARLDKRPGAVDCVPDTPWEVVAERLGAAGVEWALTGSIAANWIVESAGSIWPVFYVADVDAAVAAGRLSRLPAGVFGPRITLVPFDGVSENGRWEIEPGCWVAATDQVVLDCFAGIGSMPAQAEAVLASAEGVTL